ncbi:cupin domain-containing protein [uncultured Enterococcus sp.]|uniref:cupin domain-containing protein n=1 Tax=uncultured Enterococcus sp. TaxID=167972 RepID=UPI0025DBDD71|nr:cupin domain-containing protein [uncultured Enterococcus sp.]
MIKKEHWIETLGLIPHPEGGFYKELPASSEWLTEKNRPLYTTIYFLLTKESPSHFHQLTADEVWFFHYGQPLTVHELIGGEYRQTKLGLNCVQNEHLQYTVPKGSIFGSTVEEGYALVSCMVAPGFTFADFKLFEKTELLNSYPKHAEIIETLALETIKK